MPDHPARRPVREDLGPQRPADLVLKAVYRVPIRPGMPHNLPAAAIAERADTGRRETRVRTVEPAAARQRGRARCTHHCKMPQPSPSLVNRAPSHPHDCRIFSSFSIAHGFGRADGGGGDGGGGGAVEQVSAMNVCFGTCGWRVAHGVSSSGRLWRCARCRLYLAGSHAGTRIFSAVQNGDVSFDHAARLSDTELRHHRLRGRPVAGALARGEAAAAARAVGCPDRGEGHLRTSSDERERLAQQGLSLCRQLEPKLGDGGMSAGLPR